MKRRVLLIILILFSVPVVASVGRYAHDLLVRKIVLPNQAATSRALRDLYHEQMDYWAESNGAFADPECLSDPSECSPNYETAVVMLGVKDGYRRWFVPGPRWTEAAWTDWVKRERFARWENLPHPDGFRDFAIMAVPRYPGLTGEVGFCISMSGVAHKYYPKGAHHVVYPTRDPEGELVHQSEVEDELQLLSPPHELKWGERDACPEAPSHYRVCGSRSRGTICDYE